MSEVQIISLLIMRENMLFSGEIYTTGKNFTLPPAVTAVTNSTSVATGKSIQYFKLKLKMFLYSDCFQFVAATDKLHFMFEIGSFVDYFTIPPMFVSIFLHRTWIGVPSFYIIYLYTFPILLYLTC